MANKARKSTARILATRRAALANVRQSAFASGVSRSAVLAATFAACGAKPVLALYQGARLELQIGFMGAALARKGDNRAPDELMEHCRSRIVEYAGFGGTGSIRKDQKGRRTKDEEAAFGSARVLVSGIMKDAGVTVPEARGGDNSKTRTPRPAAKASKGKAPAANENGAPAVLRFKTAPEVVARCNVLAAALLATVNRNAAHAPNELKTIVQDVVARLKAIK